MHAFVASRRRTAAVAVAAAMITLMSGCGRNRGDTAAEVGTARVSRDVVIGAVDRALAGKTTLTRAALTQKHLTTQVRLALYREEAAKLGVTLTDEERTATRAAFEEQTQQDGGLEKAAETSGIAKEDIADVVEMATYERILAARLIKDAPVTDAELDQLRAEQPDQLGDTAHAAHILVKDEATANKVLAEVKAGGDFAALAAKYSIDTGSKDKGGDLGTNPKGKFVPAFDAALFSGKTGDFLGPVKTEFGYHIIKVIKLTTFASVKEQVRAAVGTTVGSARLQDEIKKGTTVTVNPRFGRWDADKAAVQLADAGPDDPSAPSAAPASPLAQ